MLFMSVGEKQDCNTDVFVFRKRFLFELVASTIMTITMIV